MNTAVENRRGVSQTIREILLDDLDLPAQKVVELVLYRTGETCSTEEVNQARNDVKRTIALALPPVTTMTEAKYFTNRPRIVVAAGKSRETVAMAKKGRALVDVNEKRRWLNDWALEKGGLATIKEAKEALTKQFNEALGTSYIAQTLKDARQLLLDERRRQRQLETSVTMPSELPVAAVPSAAAPSGLRETVKSIANLMRVSGIRKITIEPDGTVNFEASTAA